MAQPGAWRPAGSLATPELEPLDQQVVEQVLDLRQTLRHSLARRRRWTGLVRRVTLAEAIRSSNSIEGHRVSGDDALAAVDLEGRPRAPRTASPGRPPPATGGR